MGQRDHQHSLSKDVSTDTMLQQHQQRSWTSLGSCWKLMQRLLIRRSILKSVLLACFLFGSFYANLQSSTTNVGWNNQYYYSYGLMPTIPEEATAKAAASLYFFNKLYPVHYVPEPPKPSSVHCVGESYDRQANNASGLDFVYRSCMYQNLCINFTNSLNRKDKAELILIVANDEHHRDSINGNLTWSRVQQQYQGNPINSIDSSTMDDFKNQYFNHSKTVALSAVAAGWNLEDKKRVAWFPRVVTQSELSENGVVGFYQLDQSITLVPFIWHGASNPGHVLWDNFLPIYKLLTMFGLWPANATKLMDDNDTPIHNKTLPFASPLLLIKMPIKGYLFGACTQSFEKAPCQRMMEKLLPLMGLSPNNLMHLNNKIDTNLGPTIAKALQPASSTPQSTLVCSSQAVAGLGLLSDHGWKEHGQFHYLDYSSVHNVGKSDLVYKFRNMVLRNMGVVETPISAMTAPYRITMVVNSTKNKERLLSFERQQQAIEAALSSDTVTLERHVMQDLSLVEQLQVASGSFIYMSACGGSVVTATFLPRGASLILFYPSHRKGRRHSKLDYDFLNNLAYARVHWIPILFMNEPGELDLLVLLIQSELDRVTSMRQDNELQ